MNHFQNFLILFYATQILCLSIECEFRSAGWGEAGSLYTCASRKVWHLNVSNITFINGTHQHNMNNNDVMGLWFVEGNIENMNHFPSNIIEVFPNFRAIQIRILNNISEISSNELMNLSEMQYFGLWRSSIQSIPSDLFRFNSKLKRIEFYFNNQLISIGANLLGNLSELQSIFFKYNYCISESSDDFDEIQRINSELHILCPSEDEVQTTSTTASPPATTIWTTSISSTTPPEMNYCPKSCLEENQELRKTIENHAERIEELEKLVREITVRPKNRQEIR